MCLVLNRVPDDRSLGVSGQYRDRGCQVLQDSLAGGDLYEGEDLVPGQL